VVLLVRVDRCGDRGQARREEFRRAEYLTAAGAAGVPVPATTRITPLA
jgi:hypothetical protein